MYKKKQNEIERSSFSGLFCDFLKMYLNMWWIDYYWAFRVIEMFFDGLAWFEIYVGKAFC